MPKATGGFLMDIITTVHDMQRWADGARARGQRIGLVPTMGYLHAGHLSLVETARQHADCTVVSIFVNPLQFGANEDLDRYPRDLEADTCKLAAAGADVLFLPDTAAVYPEGFQTTVTVDQVTRFLCGAGRPVHFRGVTTVVAKLFNMVKPHVAVFGRKDYQQLVTIRRMVADLNFDIAIIAAPIVREVDGLAMSSRNAYLSPPQRRAALCLSRALAAAHAAVSDGETDGLRVLAAARRVITDEPLARLEYVSLVDPETLEDITSLNAPALLAFAVHIGQTRLIDNTLLTPRTEVPASQAGPAGGSKDMRR
jgi:pantoate--beta-alanine ligase